MWLQGAIDPRFHMSSKMLTIVVCLTPLAYLFYRIGISTSPARMPRGFVLKNKVTHARLLPKEATHTFVYPTISLLVSLNALECGELDIGRGWIFGYGGLLCRLTGIRPNPYLNISQGKRTIRDKLLNVLTPRFPNASNYLEDAWMMTMPSLLGFEGINPLTVYFCYKPHDEFWLCVLEIHNTFGESHVHILEVGEREDPLEARSNDDTNSFDHHWTFKREFHVSPFNDRSGFYKISIKCPPHPVIRVQLHTASSSTTSLSPGPLKLVAVQRCIASAPLKISPLLFTLAWAPLALFLSFPRIVYHAWILHYFKRLDVFIRPEPFPVNPEWRSRTRSSAGGVKWQPEGIFEAFARRRLESFLHRRVQETGIIVSLISANPDIPRKDFVPPQRSERCLQIDYLTPRLFTILFMSPSAAHALLLGFTTEKIFFPSSSSLFLEIFEPTITASLPYERTSSQALRTRSLPLLLAGSPELSVPPVHPLDVGNISVVSWVTVAFLQAMDELERLVFAWVHARPVPGDEPWKQWERAENIWTKKDEDCIRDPCGSNYRPR